MFENIIKKVEPRQKIVLPTNDKYRRKFYGTSNILPTFSYYVHSMQILKNFLQAHQNS